MLADGCLPYRPWGSLHCGAWHKVGGSWEPAQVAVASFFCLLAFLYTVVFFCERNPTAKAVGFSEAGACWQLSGVLARVCACLETAGICWSLGWRMPCWHGQALKHKAWPQQFKVTGLSVFTHFADKVRPEFPPSSGRLRCFGYLDSCSCLTAAKAQENEGKLSSCLS